MLGLICGIAALTRMIPLSLNTLCIATHIEMMKDGELVNSVVKDQKIAKAERGLRILAAFRMLRSSMVRQILSESIPVKRDRVENLVDRKIDEVTESLRLRDMSTQGTFLDESALVNRLEDDEALVSSATDADIPKLTGASEQSMMLDNGESINFEDQ